MRFLSAHFSGLLWFLWMAARPSGGSTTPPSFVSSTNSASSSSKDGSSKIGPHYWPLGCTASYWPPTRLSATNCHPLGPAIPPVFNPPQPTSIHLTSVVLHFGPSELGCLRHLTRFHCDGSRTSWVYCPCYIKYSIDSMLKNWGSTESQLLIIHINHNGKVSWWFSFLLSLLSLFFYFLFGWMLRTTGDD